MKIVAVVPIKLNNQRCPGKNIRKFDDGTPLVHLILDTLLKVPELDEIYVYCSDKVIKEYLPTGVKFLERTASLDRDETKGNEILQCFLEDVDADIYVLTHTTAPFTTAHSISDCIDKVKAGNYDSAFLAKKETVFLWEDGKPLNYNSFDIPRTQDLRPISAEGSGAYVFSRNTFLEYHSRIGATPYIHEIGEIESIDIDYEEDFVIANAVYMDLKRKGLK